MRKCLEYCMPPVFSLIKSMPIEEHKDLSRYSRIGIGGNARFFSEANTSDDCLNALEFAHERNIPVISIGEGSNVAFEDGIIDALVLRVIDPKAKVSLIESSPGRVSCGGAMRLKSFISELASLGIDASNFAGIPGSVAGAMVNNSGSNNDAIGSHLVRATVVDKTGTVEELQVEYFRYGLRNSALKASGNHIILSGEFDFPQRDPESIRQKIKERISNRKSKEPTGLTLGSTFKNPTGCELSAGKLIDIAGFKGYRIGNLLVSPEHANWLINLKRGTVTAADLRRLLYDVRDEVQRLTGILLEEEIQILGKA